MVDGQHRLACMRELWSTGKWQPKADQPPLTAETMQWPVVVVEATAEVCSMIAHCKFSFSVFALCVCAPRILGRWLGTVVSIHIGKITMLEDSSWQNAPAWPDTRPVLSGASSERSFVLTGRVVSTTAAGSWNIRCACCRWSPRCLLVPL